MAPTLRKAGYWLIALCVLLSSWAAPVSAAFRDTEGHWAKDAINTWQDYGVISGSSGQFRPNDPVTRAEFAVMLDKIMKYQVQGSHGFADLPDGSWYSGPMARLAAAGVLSGANGKALPERPVSRQEAAALLSRAFDLKPKAGASVRFADEGDIAAWARDAVRALVSLGVLNGYPDNTFKPGRTLTRAEAVTLFDRLIARFLHAPGEYEGDAAGIVVINSPDVTLKNAKISGDLIITQGVGNGDVTLDNVTVEGTVHVYGGGENTILFHNVQVSGSVIVDKHDNKVRIVASGNTTVSVTILESGAMLVTRELAGGGFETVEISADLAAGQEIVLEGDFGKVINRSSGVQITAEGTIQELVSEANTNISGDVRIDQVTVASNDIEVTVNGEKAAPGQPAGTTASGGSGGGGGTPGGGSGGGGGGGTNPGGNDNEPGEGPGEDDDNEPGDGPGGGDGPAPVELTGINVEQTIDLYVGDTHQVNVTPEPANAKLPNLIWYVADYSDDVITVDQNGVIKAVSPGSKYVVVRAEGRWIYDAFLVNVKEPTLTLEIDRFATGWIPAGVHDEAVLENSGKLVIEENAYGLSGPNYAGWTVKPSAPLNLSNDSSVTDAVYAYVVLTIKDHLGQPLKNTTDLSVSYEELIRYNDYGNLILGEGIADTKGDSSFLLPIRHPEKRSLFWVTVRNSHNYDNLAEALIDYLPYGGMTVMTGLGPIEGEPGYVLWNDPDYDPASDNRLTAGEPIFAGGIPDPDERDEIEWLWVKSEKPDGPYLYADYGNEYQIREEDIGKYVRLVAISFSDAFGGIVASDPVGPIQSPYTEEEFFAEWLRVMLDADEDGTPDQELSGITKPLHFASTLSKYPGTLVSVTTSKTELIDNYGYVYRDPHADRTVLLHVRTSGVVDTFRIFEATIAAENPMDPYFAEKPRAYVNAVTQTVWVEFKLKEPAEVFMTVDPWHYPSKTRDASSVVYGHAGGPGGFGYWVEYAEATPYFAADPDHLEQHFDTGVKSNRNDIRVDFVIRDEEEGYVSAQPTAVIIEGYPDNITWHYPSVLAGAYINEGHNAIYLHFSDWLDRNDLPKPEDFKLSVGTVKSVSHSDELLGYVGVHYLKLDLKDPINADEVTVSYQGSDLRDGSGNEVVIENAVAVYLEPSIRAAVLSHDRKTLILDISPGWNNSYFVYGNTNRFSVEVENGNDHEVYEPDDVDSHKIWEFDGGKIAAPERVYLTFHDPLPEGDISVSFFGELNGWAYPTWTEDPYPNVLTFSNVRRIAVPGEPSVTYHSSTKRLTLSFADGFEFGESSPVFLGYFELEIDGRKLPLRGFQATILAPNALVMDLSHPYYRHFGIAIEDGEDVKLNYKVDTAKFGYDNYYRLKDVTETAIPDFGPVTVNKR